MKLPEGLTPYDDDQSLPAGLTPLESAPAALPLGLTPIDTSAHAVAPPDAGRLSPQSAPRHGLPIPESTHPGDLAFKEKLAADARARVEKESTAKTIGREAAFGVVPTLAGIAGGAAAGAGIGAVATGPLAPAGAIVGGLVGGIGTAIGAEWLQGKALDAIAPEQAAQWQAERAAASELRPGAALVGNLAPQLLALKPSFKNVASAAKGAKALINGTLDLATPAGKEMAEQIFNVGIGAGVQGAQEAYAQYQAGDFNAARMAAQIISGAIINEPNRFGVRLGLHPSTGEVEVQPVGDTPRAGAEDAPAIDVQPEIINEPRQVDPARAGEAPAVPQEQVIRQDVPESRVMPVVPEQPNAPQPDTGVADAGVVARPVDTTLPPSDQTPPAGTSLADEAAAPVAEAPLSPPPAKTTDMGSPVTPTAAEGDTVQTPAKLQEAAAEASDSAPLTQEQRLLELIRKDKAELAARESARGRVQDEPTFQTTRGKVQGATLPEQRATTRTMMEPLGGKWTEGASDGHIGTWTDGKGTTIEFRHAGVEGPTTGPRAGETAMGMTQRTGRGKYTVTVDAKNGDITTPPHELAEIIGMAARGGMSEPYHRIVKKAIGIDLSTPDGAHQFAVQMETQAGRNKIADDLLNAAPGVQQGFRKWLNGLIRMVNRLFGANVAEFKDPDFKKLANGMRDFTALKQLAQQDATRTTAYQTRQPTGNPDADSAGVILDRMEAEAAKVLQGNKRPLLRRVRDFVGRNIATVNAPINTRRAALGRDGLQALAERSYIAQQAQQGASSRALDRFNGVTEEWKRIGIKADDVPELGKYMTAQRALELYNQFDSGVRTEEVKSPLRKEQADAFVRATEAGPNGQKMKDAAAAARKAFNDSLDVLLESGTISRDSYNKIKASSQFYFPRAFLDHIDPPTGIIEKTKFGDVQVRQSGVRHLMEGSEGDMLTDPLMLLAQNISHAETLAAKNKSMNALRDLAEAATPQQRANTDFDIREIPWQQTARRGYEKVEFWKNGEKKALEVRTDLAEALKMLDPGLTSDIAKLARHLSGTSLVKFMATSGNPEFAIGNIARDLGLHYLAGGEYSAVMPVAMAQQVKQAAKVSMNRTLKAKLREGYSKYGGGSERLSTSDFMPNPLQSKAYKHSKSLMQSVLGVMGYVGNKSEELSRLMLVNQALKNMGTDAYRATPDQWAKAVSIGKEIINFHDHGKLIKVLDTVVPFLNPSFQGGRSIARAFKTRPLETTLKASQIVAAGALMAWWNRQNDAQAWESMSDSEKSTKFLIGVNAARKDKDGVTRYGYLGIPVDQGWRPFMILGQMIADKLDGREVNTALLEKSIKANYVPMDFANMPPIASAMLTYGQNHDFWTGDKVWKGRKVDPVMEQKPSTPAAAVKIGEATGMSPERLNAAAKKLLPSNPINDVFGSVADAFDHDAGRDMREDNMVRMSQWTGVRRIFRVTSPRELRDDDVKAAKRLRVNASGKPAAQVLNEIERAEVKQNSYRQANDLKYDKMIALVKSGQMSKSDLLREVQKTKDASGRADLKEITRIRRRLHDRYPALNIPAPRSRND